MKVSELLKLLENVKIDEDEINGKSEIAKYLAQKLNIPSAYIYFIMTKDREIYDSDSYEKFLESAKISPDEAYVYVKNADFIGNSSVDYLYPLIGNGSKTSLVYAYLSKLGISSLYAVPATGLRYFATVFRFLSIGHMVVEVTDIDNDANNTNLPTLIRDIVGTKYIDASKVEDIALQLNSQKLFAGYNSDKAWRILYRYYEKRDTSLAEEVEVIRDAYNHIFKPYRVVYDLKTKQFIPT